ncbi:MAG: DNA photolyase family protein [Rhodovulum sp.]|jgi:deoxyribodipyrimidine photo-lyase|nr:DNA photolyase family protein [Rhodovulum sp.]
MTQTPPVIMWFRRDLRLSDNAALMAAVKAGAPVIPLFILDEVTEDMGAAPKWRLGLSVAALAQQLADKGTRLILRRGRALDVLRDVIAETGAGAVHWSRLYDPDSRKRDEGVKSALKDDGISAQSHAGHILFEPWTVETKSGGDFYKVYSPFWRAVKDRPVADLIAAPRDLNPPADWPTSDDLDDWGMGDAMVRGRDVVLPHTCVGEEAAIGRLGAFVAHKIDAYKAERDYPAAEATSRLSENLTYGEIAPARIWHTGARAMAEGARGAEHFLKELVWRDFAYHLIYHTPHITTDNWREGWDNFGWNTDETRADVVAWKQGRTGNEFVDAAMREMYVTGTMHNRSRMIVGSYLCKHLLSHWRIGQAWFADCLIDWDPASNAMGWQWIAGSGPDAAPYFRIFNPDTQLDKFDADHAYRKAWIAEERAAPSKTALSYFDAVPRSWNLSPDAAYPDPVIDLAEGRARALAAYDVRDD